MSNVQLPQRTRRRYARLLQVALARHPMVYSYLLRICRRGSPEKLACLALVRRGATVLDLGANEGYFTLLLSDLVGPRGRVHAFEAMPPTFRPLETNVKNQACHANIFLHGVAVSSDSGRVSMNMPGQDYEQASLMRHDRGSWGIAGQTVTTHDVASVRLDDHLAADIPVEFVKCDIEGAELPALQGLAKVLGSRHPILLLEIFDAWTRDFGYGPAEMFQFLAKMGYSTVVLLEATPRYLENPEVAFAGELRGRSVNVICAHARDLGRLRRIM